MENQELEKEMRSMWGSLNGLSWPISRSSLAETVASLEPELLQWASPIEVSAETTHVPLVDLISAPGLIDQSVSPYIYTPGTPDLSTAFIWDNTTKSAAGSRLGSARTSLDDCSAGTNLSCAAQRSDGLPRSTEELEAFQSPFTPETGQPPANSLQGSFWDEPWDAAAMELSASAPSSGLCTLAVLSPACSLDLESCEAATSRGTIASADLRILDERAGSTDSNKSYAFAAAWPAGAPLPDHSPDPLRTPQPVSPLAAVKLTSAAVAPVVAFPSAPGTPRPAAAPVRDQAPAHRDNAPAPSMRPPAGPPTPPARPAAAKVPDQPCAQGGIASAWAKQPPARPPSPPAPAPITGPSATGCQHTQVQPSARTMAMLQKNRRQQKEYNQRKRARNLAVHANVETLKERKAALEQDMGALLTQHEQLTRQQPWAQQHEEVHFIASITTLMPAPADKCGSKETAQGRDLLSRLMLDPTATMESLCKPASHANSLAAMKACAPAETQAPSTQPPYTEWGLADSDSIAWSSILACLRLSKVQKDDIVALYENHLQEMAALQQDCLDVAYKLQGLHHCVAGELTDCAWPNMVTHLVSAQLAGIAGREQEMIRCLMCACHKVLDTAQQRNLALLAPAAAADLRALCREVSGSCRPPRKAPASAPAKRVAPAENALPAPPAAGLTLLAARALPATSVAGTAAASGSPQQVLSAAPQEAGCCKISAVVEAPVVGTVFSAEAKLYVPNVAAPAAKGGPSPAVRESGPAIAQLATEAVCIDARGDAVVLPHLGTAVKTAAAQSEAAAQPAYLTRGLKRQAEAPQVEPETNERIFITTVPLCAACNARTTEGPGEDMIATGRAAADWTNESAYKANEETALHFPLHQGHRMKARKMLSVWDLHNSMN